MQEDRAIPIQQAIDAGATALFGEKYGDTVRMITFDADYSRELCGGTQVAATGAIGLFKISAETSVAAGVRRIEAITGIESQKRVYEQEQLLKSIKELLKAPKDITLAIKNLVNEKAQLEKKVQEFSLKQIGELKQNLIQAIEDRKGMNVLIQKVDLPDADALKKLAFELRNQFDALFLVLAANINEKPMVGVMFADELVKEKQLHAGNLVRDLAKSIKGGGGGQPFFATAGGKDVSGLEKVIEEAQKYVESL